MCARLYFLRGTVLELQVSHPDSVSEMVAASRLSVISEDGKVRSARAGKLMYGLDEVYQQGLTRAYDDDNSESPSAEAIHIQNTDTWTKLAKPICYELPQTILDIVTNEPTGPVAVEYRRYIKTVLMPLCRRVAGMLEQEHSAVIGN
eukprot:SAG31_NODE_7439_length_1689_cov_1.104403_2_plen_147_part_00